jgi:hypothetical protein
MAFQKKFGGGSIADVASAPPAPSGKKGKKPFGRKGGFQKKGFTPALRSLGGGGR